MPIYRPACPSAPSNLVASLTIHSCAIRGGPVSGSLRLCGRGVHTSFSMPFFNSPPLTSVSAGRLYRVGLVGSALVAIALIAVLVIYQPLPADGGWYSYPAFALSLGRNGYEQWLPVDTLLQAGGLRAVFEWDTTSSTRTLIMAAWFRVIGHSLLSVRLLAVAELAALLCAAHLMYRRHFGASVFAGLCTLLLLHDKNLLAGASDARPDIALAALACMLYLVLQRRTVSAGTVFQAIALAALAATLHLTSPIPLAFVFTAAFVDAWLDEAAVRRARIALITGTVLVAAVAFLVSDRALGVLLDRPAQLGHSFDLVTRIVDGWRGGVLALAQKEVQRWLNHYFLSNATELLAVALGLAAAIGFRSRGIPTALKATLAGLAAAVVVTAAFDPHISESHILPLVPFTILLLQPLQRFRPWRVIGAMAGLLTVATLLSGVLAWRIAREAQSIGFSNQRLTSELTALTRGDSPSVVIGGAELWPYFGTDDSVVLLDLTRNPLQVSDAAGFSRARFIVATADYLSWGWDRHVQEMVSAGRATIRYYAPGRVLIAELHQ